MEALERKPGRRPHLLLVGDGRQRNHIEQRAKSLGLLDSVTITGRIAYEEVAPALAASDLCVAPFNPDLHNLSKKRGFALDPLKVFEYLALGKPTITVRSQNIQDLFEHGTHLRMGKAGDVAELAENIEWMMNNPEDAKSSAALGRDIVLKSHTWAAHAAHLASLFEEMMAEAK